MTDRENMVGLLRQIAVRIEEPPGPQAVFRLLERANERDEAERLRAVLLELGASRILEAVRKEVNPCACE